MQPQTHKICKECKTSMPKTREFFHGDKDGFHSVCKSCRNSKAPIVSDISWIKKCASCEKELPANLENFHYSKRDKCGLRSKCKNCRNAEKKTYRNENKDLINEKNRQYARKPENAEKIKNNRQTKEYKEKSNKYSKDLYRNSLEFRIKHNLRTSFNRYLSSKTKTSFEYIGLPLDDFKKHIESKFVEGMTWENYGKFGWHIDHIIPLKHFNFEKYANDKEELEKRIHEAFHYTNLQPLWAKDNISKGCKLLSE